MRKLVPIAFILPVVFFIAHSCKKITTVPNDFATITMTGAECNVIGHPDTTQWNNDVLNYALDTQLLTFSDTVVTTDSIPGPISTLPVCPNPSSGFFIWHITAARESKLKLVCINQQYEILYYNVYHLRGGPVEIGFDFAANTAFKNDSSYRMFYAFYNAHDSILFAGHGDFNIIK